MNKALIISQKEIEDRIFTIQGLQVMLDSHLAEMYQVKAIRLWEQVKRNAERFSKNFMFRLTEEEADFMVSQNARPSRKHLGGFLKDLGKKWSAFSKIDTEISPLLNKLKGGANE